MTDADLQHLIAHIDNLLERHLEARSKKKMAAFGQADIDAVLEHGAYPPDNPSSGPQLALFAVGETLGRVGGKDLMDKILGEHSKKYGSEKAGRLSARWETAAGVWY